MLLWLQPQQDFFKSVFKTCEILIILRLEGLVVLTDLDGACDRIVRSSAAPLWCQLPLESSSGIIDFHMEMLTFFT